MLFPESVTLTVAALAVFLIFITALKYAVEDSFSRARLGMTAFFCFIVATLTLSFSQYVFATLWFSVPAVIVGMLVGHFIGVKAAKEKLMLQGAEHYLDHLTHIHLADVANLQWWAFINFYSIIGALVLINLVGLSNVIMGGSEAWAVGTSAAGAFLIGTIFPYLVHLWRIRAHS